jgi:hypothetical protein
MLKWLQRLFTKPKHATGCHAFCLGCLEDLTRNGALCWDDEIVCYVCPCGTVSRWDFGPPAPIVLWSNTKAK